MHITRVEINNILSIESATLDISDSGLTLIDGWNFDDDRANGAGKTAICNAIAFALYDTVPRKITKSEILRWGAKQGYAKVTLHKGGRVFEVTRARPSGVEFSVDGVSRDITQEEFESEIGLNYQQFIIAMYNAQGDNENFIFLNDRSKKDFMLNLMDLSILNDCHKRAKEEIRGEEKKINEEKIKLQGYISKIQAYSESLADESQIESSIRDKEAKIRELEEKINEYTSVPKPDLSNFDQIEEKIREKRKKFQEIRQELAVKRSELKRLNTQIVSADNGGDDAGGVQCPACNEALAITGNSVSLASDKETIRERHRDHVRGLQGQSVAITSDINSLESSLLKESELDKLTQDIKRDRSTQYSDYGRAQEQIKDINRVIQNNQTELWNFQHQLSASKENQEKISLLKVEAKEVQDSVKASFKNVELLEQAAQIFSPTGAPAYIMDSAVDSFNAAVTQYVQLVWPSATYSLQAYKEKKDGSKTAKFSESLLIGGKKCSIGALSGGQQRALALAVDFAIRDVMDAQFGIHMNPIILDEPFDGLDSVGRGIVIELLEELSVKRSIWVIDHASEAKAMFNDVIRIEKRSGITSIVS